MLLERESATYREKLPELSKHEGRYVLIQGSDVIDTFGSYEDALRQGYRQFGLQPFLVKQIQSSELVQFITRTVEPHGPNDRWLQHVRPQRRLRNRATNDGVILRPGLT